MASNVSCECNEKCLCFKAKQKCNGSCKCKDCKNQDLPCDLRTDIKIEKDQSQLNSAWSSGLQQQKDLKYGGARPKDIKPPLPTKIEKLESSSSMPNLKENNKLTDAHKIQRSRSLDMSIKTKYLTIDLTIMTINGSHSSKFKLDDDEKGQNMFLEKMKLIKKAFHKSKADIVCGQEFSEKQILSLCQCLVEYGYTSKAERRCHQNTLTKEYTSCNTTMFNVIFYKKLKFIVEPVRQENINRAFTDDTKFSIATNDDKSRNRFHAAKVITKDSDPNNSFSFGVVSYHGFHLGFSDPAKYELAGQYFEIFNALSRKHLGNIPMVVCGDFNYDITQKKVSGNFEVCDYMLPVRRPNKIDFITYNISPHPKHSNNDIFVKPFYTDNINLLDEVSKIKVEKAQEGSYENVADYENRAIILDHDPIKTKFRFFKFI